MENLIECLSIAENAGREAGALLKAGGEKLRRIQFQDRSDVKLKADTDSETLIRKLLGDATPFPVVGEEMGGDDSLVQKDEFYWVVDPLDGTFNYLRGSPLCSVSIGLLRGTEPVLGVIYDFNQNILFSGSTEHGFFINGEKINPLWATELDQAALVTGLPAGMDQSPENLSLFVHRISKFKKVRMVGSAALALAYVAAGYADVYYEQTIRLWDVAAGLALVKASGGMVQMVPSPSGKFLAFDVCASGNEDFLIS